MSKPAKPAPAAAPAEAVPARNNKLPIIIIGVLLLVIAGGVGWYLTKGHEAPADAHVEAKPAPVLEPKFIPLGEKFTVNLQREEGDQYLQVGITLKILEADLEMKIKAAMPEIRSRLLILLSSKKPSELITTEGKQLLVEQIITEVDGILGVAAAAPAAATHAQAAHGEGQAEAHGASAPAASAAAKAPKTTGVVDVLFSDFIIQ